jgi:thiamine-monophosphate kinase
VSSEFERIALLRARLGAAPDHVLVGIGDDAAVLAPGSEPLVWTVDAAVEGVHFRRGLLSWSDIAARATAAALSDLAAMGAAPLGVLASLVLPDDVDDGALAGIADGQREACAQAGTAVIGGNLARGAELSITTTALGCTPLPMRREGARAGDVLWLAGEVGMAAAGLVVLEASASRAARGSVAAEEAVAAFRRPSPRIAEGIAARAVARAAIDVSDGLAQDLGHLARASGVRMVLDASALASPSLLQIAGELGRDPLELALHGGEDYALVVVAPSRAMLPGFRRIGGCEPRAEGDALVVLTAADGTVTPVADRGWNHWAAG